MIIAVYLPIVASVVLALAGPAVGLRLPPKLGAWLLTLGAVVVSVTYLWALTLLAATLIDELPEVANRLPVPSAVAVVAAGMLLVGVGRAVWSTRQRWRLEDALREACAGTADDIVVLADARPQAFALRGRPGRVVVSQGMLRALTPGQRRVLFAHERAHLHGHHGELLAAVRTAAALNPLLVPVSQTVAYLCERWADEVAAGSVGDRRLTAQALAAAALASVDTGPRPTPAFHELSVGRRVAALQAPAPAWQFRGLATVSMLLLCGVVLDADLVATDQFVGLLRSLLRF
jgi:Zn-dependent protease with chaperone function